MAKQSIEISVQPLKLALKTTIRHAAATRNEGESVWVQARRQNVTGFGEGCPRAYVAGDDLDSSIAWVQENFSSGQLNFEFLDELRQWVRIHEKEIDRYPSAWCAVEMAVLDLLAREKKCAVEDLLGVDAGRRLGRYTAVLGDSKTWQFASLVDQYLVRGFTDFKIKLNGNPERDLPKLDLLEALSAEHHIASFRVRLDANNLWNGRCDEAIAYARSLGVLRFFAMEEPVQVKDVGEISRFATETGLCVILDESLCTEADLLTFRSAPGRYIANIKVSRVGGLIRTLGLIETIRKMGWWIIIGCHVGETSLLTRAALVASSSAGESLLAQEGAFGDYLVKREPAEPMLKFGHAGLLDLRMPYYLRTVSGLKVVGAENWGTAGFGMQCRMPKPPDDGSPEIRFLKMPDQYRIHYRQWGPPEGEEAFLILHGGVSHSGWQAPLAMGLRSLSPQLTVIAPDRRGSGLNDRRGDLGSVHSVIEDVTKHVEFLKKSFQRVHLAGWCQGAQFAAVAASGISDAISSLILLTPGFFWNERFRSVLSITENVIMDMISTFKLKPDRDFACIPVPMEATDFTLVDEWLDYIEQDDLKTMFLTLKSARIMDEIQEMSWLAMLACRLPTLVILGEQDRIVDNRKVLQFLDPLFSEASASRILSLTSGHAIHFEKTREVASAIVSFTGNLKDLH